MFQYCEEILMKDRKAYQYLDTRFLFVFISMCGKADYMILSIIPKVIASCASI